MFAAGTEKGKLLIGDITNGLKQNPWVQTKGNFDPHTDQLAQTYYLNFPQRSTEKSDPHLLVPCVTQQVHQNSIFDLTWLGDEQIVTASGDQSGIVFDVET